MLLEVGARHVAVLKQWIFGAPHGSRPIPRLAFEILNVQL
jgi:hypothetical protein